jgi:hypothetical protein
VLTPTVADSLPGKHSSIAANRRAFPIRGSSAV